MKEKIQKLINALLLYDFSVVRYDLFLLDYYQVIFFSFFTTTLLNDTSEEIIDHDCY